MFIRTVFASNIADAPVLHAEHEMILPVLIFALVLSIAFGIYKALSCKKQKKKLKAKIVELQNSVISSQKELEDIKKEKHRQMDPYSSPNTKSLFLSIDKDGKILSINEYACEFFGYTEEELLGKNVIGFLVPQKDSRGNVLTNIIERITNNPRLYIDYENENICKDGRPPVKIALEHKKRRFGRVDGNGLFQGKPLCRKAGCRVVG